MSGGPYRPNEGLDGPSRGFGGPGQGFNDPGRGFGGPGQGFGGPSLPPVPPSPPPMPAGPPPAPPDAWRALATALLNLSGLGLGYALLRRWVLTAVCWAATAVLLLVALPADADGIPGPRSPATPCSCWRRPSTAGSPACAPSRPGRTERPSRCCWVCCCSPYRPAARSGTRTPTTKPWSGRSSAGWSAPNDLVAASGRRSFGSAARDYRTALEVYRDIAVHHAGSRAAEKVPDSLRTYYTTVGAAYGHREYCAAVEPLKYLRTVPDTIPKEHLGSLAGWPDDRLATALYECGAGQLATGGADWVTRFGDLLDTFPRSGAAARVVPAVDAAVRKAEKAVDGDEPLRGRRAVARPRHPDRRPGRRGRGRGRPAGEGRGPGRPQRRHGPVRVRRRPVRGRRLRRGAEDHGAVRRRPREPPEPGPRREDRHSRRGRADPARGRGRSCPPRPPAAASPSPSRTTARTTSPSCTPARSPAVFTLKGCGGSQGVHARGHGDPGLQALQRQQQALPAAHHQPARRYHVLRAQAAGWQHRDPGIGHRQAQVRLRLHRGAPTRPSGWGPGTDRRAVPAGTRMPVSAAGRPGAVRRRSPRRRRPRRRPRRRRRAAPSPNRCSPGSRPEAEDAAEDAAEAEPPSEPPSAPPGRAARRRRAGRAARRRAARRGTGTAGGARAAGGGGRSAPAEPLPPVDPPVTSSVIAAVSFVLSASNGRDSSVSATEPSAPATALSMRTLNS